jgi:hypothetical protein
MFSQPGGLWAHKTKKSLEVYQHLSLQAVESAYQEAVQSLKGVTNGRPKVPAQIRRTLALPLISADERLALRANSFLPRKSDKTSRNRAFTIFYCYNFVTAKQ